MPLQSQASSFAACSQHTILERDGIRKRPGARQGSAPEQTGENAATLLKHRCLSLLTGSGRAKQLRV